MTNSRLPSLLFAVLFLLCALASSRADAAAPRSADAISMSSSHFFTLIAASGRGHNALQADSEKPKPSDPLPDGKGKDVTKRVCSGCHGVTVFAQQRHTPEQWASIVDTMVAKGLDATDDELTTITDYLSTNLPAPKQDAPASTSPDSSSK